MDHVYRLGPRGSDPIFQPATLSAVVGQPGQRPPVWRGAAEVDPAPPREQTAPVTPVDVSPVDAATPVEAEYVRGVASVPVPPRQRGDDTGAYGPVVQEASRPAVPTPPRGMVVRRRWRQLRAGAGWSWTGGSFVVVCWGIWAVTLRGSGLFGPLLALALVFATAGLVFIVSRLLGRAVLENALGRERRSAWPSHLAAGGFLILAGLAFLQQTWWIAKGWSWLVERLLP